MPDASITAAPHLPFSRSPFWQWQRDYFRTRRLDAWRQGDVPHYVTSNPAMAAAYAQLLLGFVRDIAAASTASPEPVHIVELGAGSGRFSYHMLRALDALRGSPVLARAPLRYVMTDFVPETLDFWRRHPRLKPYIDRGALDFALFDAEAQAGDTLTLTVSGETLTPGDLAGPLVAIANYFFDSLPPDLYHIDDGDIAEVLVAVTTGDTPADASPARLLAQAELDYTARPLDRLDHLPPTVADLLEIYRNGLADAVAPIPAVGLACVERLKALSRRGLLLISADKGLSRLEEWEGRGLPHIARHGSVSLAVNYHAVRRHCEALGGAALLPLHKPAHLVVGAFLYLDDPQGWPETRLAYEKHVRDTGPDTFYSLKKHINHTTDDLGVAALFAAVRSSGHDARLFRQLLGRVAALKDEFSDDDRYAFLQMAARVWDGYYPLGEKEDLALEIAAILIDLGFPGPALSFLDVSERLYGDREAPREARAACRAAPFDGS